VGSGQAAIGDGGGGAREGEGTLLPLTARAGKSTREAGQVRVEIVDALPLGEHEPAERQARRDLEDALGPERLERNVDAARAELEVTPSSFDARGVLGRGVVSKHRRRAAAEERRRLARVRQAALRPHEKERLRRRGDRRPIARGHGDPLGD
jgi:hypothetical protein